MKPIFLLAAIMLPALSGGLLLLRKPKNDRALRLFSGITMAISVGFGWALLLRADGGSLTLLRFTRQLSVMLCFDGTGRFFAAIVSAAFPLTLLYADAYTEGGQGRAVLFGGLGLAYAAALGCCAAGNLLTLIVFGELLSFCAVPLLCYQRTVPMSRAARMLLLFSAGGTVLTVSALVFLARHNAGGAFAEAAGGTLPTQTARLCYLLGVVGFGVKAAVVPMHFWLLRLSSAPTPSAAVIEAVCLTNVGLLSILRLTFHCFGVEVLAGSWVQTAVCSLSLVTILFSASMAVKQRPWKRKLAYSTVANLSYCLFAISLMTAEGFAAALLHAAFHTCGKLLAFFCAGSALRRLEQAGGAKLDGLGRKMPLTFAAYTLASASLVGVPPLCGFVGKWHILTAAASAQTTLAYLGAGVLLAAALLAAIYLFTNVCRAWFPPKDKELSAIGDVRESPRRMLLCFLILGLCLVFCGVCGGSIVRAAMGIAG